MQKSLVNNNGCWCQQKKKVHLLKEKIEISSFPSLMGVYRMLIAMDIIIYTSSHWRILGWAGVQDRMLLTWLFLKPKLVTRNCNISNIQIPVFHNWVLKYCHRVLHSVRHDNNLGRRQRIQNHWGNHLLFWFSCCPKPSPPTGRRHWPW